MLILGDGIVHKLIAFTIIYLFKTTRNICREKLNNLPILQLASLLMKR